MLGHTTASLRRTRGFCFLNSHVRPVCDFHVRAICHYQTACGITDGQRTARGAFRFFCVCFRSFGLFYTAADGQLGICTLAGARTVTCAAIAHTDTFYIDAACKDTLFLVFNCLGAINGILVLQGKVHIGIVLYVDTHLTVLCQVNLGIIQRQVNVSSFVIILAFQIHTDIDTMAASGQVGIPDCQVNICTLAHLDDGFIFFGICICGHFSRGVSRGTGIAGIYIHAVNHDGCIFHIFFDRDGVCGCGLRRGAVLCVVARSIGGLCVIIRRCGYLCAIVGVISGWRVAVLDVDRTIASFRFILIDVGAVFFALILTLITVRAAFLILVNCQLFFAWERVSPKSVSSLMIAHRTKKSSKNRSFWKFLC